MERLVGTLGIDRLSKSQVGEMAKHPDGHAATFRTRSLDVGHHAFVAAGALVLKVPGRLAGR
jgi:putative transposase